MVDFESNQGIVYAVYNKHFTGFGYLQEDLIQEGLLALWKACSTFDESRGCTFSTYAFTVVANAMRMYLRKEKRHTETLPLDDTRKMPGDIEGTIVQAMTDADTLDKVMHAAKCLGYEDIVRLKIAGAKQVEIAEALGVTQATISKRLSAIFEKVKKELL